MMSTAVGSVVAGMSAGNFLGPKGSSRWASVIDDALGVLSVIYEESDDDRRQCMEVGKMRAPLTAPHQWD